MIIDSAQKYAYRTVDTALVIRNRFIGKRIAEEEVVGDARAEYGKEIIARLSAHLTGIYGKGFSTRALYQYLSFYRLFPEIVNSVSTQFESSQKVNSVSTQSVLLSWTHYRVLIQVNDSEARSWYEKEAYNQTWSVRTLQRNISTQYYHRMLKSQDKTSVENEMKQLTSQYQNKLEFIKNPVIAEFLGMQEVTG